VVNLKECRKKAGISQAELARRVNDMEDGGRNIDIDALLEKLAPYIEYGKLEQVEAILLEVMGNAERDSGMGG